MTPSDFNYRKALMGAIAGDTIGSVYERHGVKSTDFPLWDGGHGRRKNSTFTDDTVMTLAVAHWLVTDPTHSHEKLVECMQTIVNAHPHAGYGGSFKGWLAAENPKPYNSWGNGSAMRVCAVGLYAKSMQEALDLAKISAEVSHDHPEGIKGAQAIALAVYIAKTSGNKAKIKDFVSRMLGYNLNRTVEDIRPSYHFDVSCQGSVPEAIISYLDGTDYESVIRNAISLGGDSDTLACMAGGIASSTIGSEIPDDIETEAYNRLTPDLQDIVDEFAQFMTEQ